MSVGEGGMERVTMRFPSQQIEALERLVERGIYPNRSEAVRAAVRGLLREHRVQSREQRAIPREWPRGQR